MVDGTEKTVSLSAGELHEIRFALEMQLEAYQWLAANLKEGAADRVARLESLLQKLCKSSA